MIRETIKLIRKNVYRMLPSDYYASEIDRLFFAANANAKKKHLRFHLQTIDKVIMIQFLFQTITTMEAAVHHMSYHVEMRLLDI